MRETIRVLRASNPVDTVKQAMNIARHHAKRDGYTLGRTEQISTSDGLTKLIWDSPWGRQSVFMDLRRAADA
jgi:hypothetical protein